MQHLSWFAHLIFLAAFKDTAYSQVFPMTRTWTFCKTQRVVVGMWIWLFPNTLPCSCVRCIAHFLLESCKWTKLPPHGPLFLRLGLIQVSFSSGHFCLTLNPIRKSEFFQKSRVQAQLAVLIQFTEFEFYKTLWHDFEHVTRAVC